MQKMFIHAAVLFSVAVPAPAAIAQATLAYDVTTIKPHDPADDNIYWRYGDTSYEARNVDLRRMIAAAYNVKSWLVFGLPPWAESARYDIQAKISDVDPATTKHLTPEQRRQLMAGLLKTRFGLQMHTETKEQPVFELAALPEGSKLKPTPAPKPPADGDPPAKPQGGWSYGPGMLKAKEMDMSWLADTLSSQLERTVVDKTGLTGKYDFALKWTPQDKLGKTEDSGVSGEVPPDIFTAIKEQLGLKLSPSKAPVPTVVIDKVVQPEAN